MGNVFFPMYPADGAKLLTSMLMYCCHVRPYTAANVLIWSSSICAIVLIAWAMYSFKSSAGGGGMSAFSGVLPGFLGVMALQEAWVIWNLVQRNQLSQHQYFHAARTDVVRRRDEHGSVATLNRTGCDNPNQAFGNTSGIEDSSSCCLCNVFRWGQTHVFRVGPRPSHARETELPSGALTPQPTDPEAAERTRSDRARFLDNLQGSV